MSKVIDYTHKDRKKYLLSMINVYMFVHIKMVEVVEFTNNSGRKQPNERKCINIMYIHIVGR